MDIETALIAIKEWYDDDSYFVLDVTDTHHGSKEDWDQSDSFIAVYGDQRCGISGDEYYGEVWFQYAENKFIRTSFQV